MSVYVWPLIICLFLIGCAKAKDGSPGPVGAPGSQGPAGSQGLTGVAGQDATPVTAVKFCVNAVTVYPSSFAEYGFCISGKLYATYYDKHNAWTAEIVPGYYSSTSTSAPCNFTVAANCVIGD